MLSIVSIIFDYDDRFQFLYCFRLLLLLSKLDKGGDGLKFGLLRRRRVFGQGGRGRGRWRAGTLGFLYFFFFFFASRE